MDLGAGPWRTFCARHPARSSRPASLAAALLVFALSIDDYVVTSFVAGVGSTTLPVQIYSMVRSGVSPEINAVSTLLLVATSLLLLAASYRLEQRRGIAPRVAARRSWASRSWRAPFAARPATPAAGDRVLNVYIWSNYIAPETHQEVRGAPRRARERRPLRHQRGAAREGAVRRTSTTTSSARRTTRSRSCVAPGPAAAARPLARCRTSRNLDPRFLDRPHDRGNRLFGPVLLGHRRHRLPTAARVGDSRLLGGALGPAATGGRILMLDDAARDARRRAQAPGPRASTRTDPALLARGAAAAHRAEAAGAGLQLLELRRRAALAATCGWPRAGTASSRRPSTQDPDIAYVIPKEGSSLFLDSLAIPASLAAPGAGARVPRLHAGAGDRGGDLP